MTPLHARTPTLVLRDIPPHLRPYGQDESYRRGRQRHQRAPQQSFVLDRKGADPRAPIECPQYRVVNEVPIPCKRDNRGVISELMSCFNCGDSEHKLSECPIQFDRNLVVMNKSWKNEYARIGQWQRRERFSDRYFVKPTTEVPVIPGDKKDDGKSGTSSVDTRKSETVSAPKTPAKKPIEEMTPPPELCVWNNSEEVPEKPERTRSPSPPAYLRPHRGPYSDTRRQRPPQDRWDRGNPIIPLGYPSHDGFRGPPPPHHLAPPPPGFGPQRWSPYPSQMRNSPHQRRYSPYQPRDGYRPGSGRRGYGPPGYRPPQRDIRGQGRRRMAPYSDGPRQRRSRYQY